jgi:hypothetical protein
MNLEKTKMFKFLIVTVGLMLISLPIHALTTVKMAERVYEKGVEKANVEEAKEVAAAKKKGEARRQAAKKKLIVGYQNGITVAARMRKTDLITELSEKIMMLERDGEILVGKDVKSDIPAYPSRVAGRIAKAIMDQKLTKSTWEQINGKEYSVTVSSQPVDTKIELDLKKYYLVVPHPKDIWIRENRRYTYYGFAKNPPHPSDLNLMSLCYVIDRNDQNAYKAVYKDPFIKKTEGTLLLISNRRGLGATGTIRVKIIMVK